MSYSSFLSSSSFVSQADINSLKILNEYESGNFLDIDSSTGQVCRQYPNNFSASIWRTALWTIGASGNSDDLSSIKKVYERILLATMAGEDHFELISNSMESLSKIKYFYTERKNANAIEQIECLEKIAARILEITESSHDLGGQPIPQAYTHAIEQSFIGSYGSDHHDGATHGLSYYSFKIDAFISLNKNLSSNQLHLLKTMRSALDFGVDLYSSIGGSWEFASLDRNGEEKLRIITETKEFLSRLSDHDRELIGVLIPCGYNGSNLTPFGDMDTQKEHGKHSSPVGIRQEGALSENFLVTQYNAGGGAMGDVNLEYDLQNWRFHLLNKELPEAYFGKTVVSFGPYSQEEVSEKIYAIIKQAGTAHVNNHGYQRAVDAFQSLFDRERQIKSQSPERRFQVVGNCITRNVAEWIIDVGQRAGETDLINELLEMGQARSSWSCPKFEKSHSI